MERDVHGPVVSFYPPGMTKRTDKKRAYRAPSLTEYGSIAALTQGGGSGGDGTGGTGGGGGGGLGIGIIIDL